MFVLKLNDMRSPQIEMLKNVARAETEEELLEFVKREKVEVYADDSWGKHYRKGGPLEWYNPLEPFGHIMDIGTKADWMQNAANEFDGVVTSIPEVPK